MRKLRWFLPFVMVLSSVPVFASDVTLFGGLQRAGSLTFQNVVSNITSTTPTLVTTNPANFGTFGIRLGVGKVVGTESTFAYSPNFISTNVRGFILNQNLNIQIPTPVLKPYATVGLGTIITTSKGSGIPDIGTKLALNYGGGVKAMFGPIGGRLDVRGYTLPSVQSQSLNVVEVSLGVVFGF